MVMLVIVIMRMDMIMGMLRLMCLVESFALAIATTTANTLMPTLRIVAIGISIDISNTAAIIQNNINRNGNGITMTCAKHLEN